MSTWRYQFDQKTVDKAISSLKKGDKGPPFLQRFKGTVKKNKLYLDDKLVIPREQVKDYLRDQLLSGTVPLSRDGLYYYLSKNVVGVPRAMIDEAVRGQRTIRESDNNKPRTTRHPRRVNSKGQISFDLIDVRFKDLGYTPTGRDEHLLTLKGKSDARKFGFIFSCVDALTSLTWI